MNAHGFSAKQTGYRSSSNGSGSGNFYSWSSSRDRQYFWIRQLTSNNRTGRSNFDFTRGLSIRCIQERTGCDDEDACNYNAAANLNDGSCDYSCNGWVAADGSGPCNGSDNINFDGTSYPLVEIGGQCWFQTNLNTTTFANGDAIPLIYDAQDWLDQGNAEEAAYRTIYGDDIQSEQFDRGLLYNWYSVADERGVCPSGFHVSSETDWDMLESFLGSDDADPIRAQKSWYENYTPNGSNSAGLSVMSQHRLVNSTGYNNTSGGETNLNGLSFGFQGQFLDQQCDQCITCAFYFYRLNPSVLQLTTRTSGFNIRCLKDLPGCTDPDGCNYDAGFNIDDGSCDYACNEWVATDGTGACEGAASVTYGDTEYDLVEIGDQCWFRQDLQTTVYQNGDAIATPATSAALARRRKSPCTSREKAAIFTTLL